MPRAVGEQNVVWFVFGPIKRYIHLISNQPTMLSLREKAFEILSLHRAGRSFSVKIDNQLERLIGGTPVVFKVTQKDSESGAAPSTGVSEVPIFLYKLLHINRVS